MMRPTVLWKKPLLLVLVFAAMLTLTACASNSAALYQKGIDLFAKGDYAEAAKIFDRLGDHAQAPVYAAYSHGLVLFEQGLYVEAEPYFAKARGFMYGETRYAYCHASALQADGAYAEAAGVFLSLTDFEDAARRGAYCEALVAEADGNHEAALYAYERAGEYGDTPIRLDLLREQIYDYAVQIRAQGEDDKALSLFTVLGEYLDSPEQAKQSKDDYCDQLMDQAEELIRAGSLREAYDVYQGLRGYRDADTRAQELASQLGIPEEESEP